MLSCCLSSLHNATCCLDCSFIISTESTSNRVELEFIFEEEKKKKKMMI